MSTPIQPLAQTLRFSGFEYPDANYIYSPNQFLDVCLVSSSRGVVRLVSYVLRQTLGFLDPNGTPVNQNISLSYQELIRNAGISRGAIRQALDEACAAGFLKCVGCGQANERGVRGSSSEYMLKWGRGREYVKHPEAFDGFFSGEGHRTPIPNSFFDVVVRYETLAVAKVVGIVLRHTIGYQNQFGGRRSSVPLSYSDIQRKTGIRDRSTLADAIQKSINRGYIARTEAGNFHPDATEQRRATYCIRWSDKAVKKTNGSKTRPEQTRQFKNPTRDGSKNQPEEPSKNPTSKKQKKKDTDKQNKLLLQDFEYNGNKFDDQTIKALASSRGVEEIRCQIDWLPFRNPAHNPLGMLRRAIEENWAKPAVCDTSQSRDSDEQRQQHVRDAEEEARTRERRQRLKDRRTELLTQWNPLPVTQRELLRSEAIKQAPSFTEKRAFSTCNLENPPTRMLELVASQLAAGE